MKLDGSRGPDEERTLNLLHKAAAGDQEAWTQLYEQHRPILRTVLHGRIPAALRSRFDTEDLLQSAFLSFSRQAPELKLDSASGLRAYLVKTLLNKLRDRLRNHDRDGKHAGREQRVSTELFNAQPAEDPSMLEQIEQAEHQARMVEAIDRLPPEDQELIWARFIEKRSWAEVAEITGLAETTARRRAHEALEILMRALM